ncbi:MAG TPA: glycosyltransferase [Candidatus Mediterraneibacter faecavium]|uniref:Glycosyltransferase n=1 Tax=Candidatus Mediterraneibacter faecavium TaxID=2838668 RepID=A0A9D2QB21_9FIRM|nr:glycosyltransferase [Candidatus Mediterraneibacter faecavium]
MKFDITVIVPVYNNVRYLRQCIDSLLSQTLKSIEILLVDDGSTDGSGDICDEYAVKDERVCVIHKKNEGLGLTRNVGMSAARGEYFTFLDSDDYVDPDMYRGLLEQANKYKADVCFGGSTLFYDCGLQIPSEMKLAQEVYRGSEIKEKVVPQILGSAPEDAHEAIIGYSMCTGIYRRSIVKEHNITFYSERVYKVEDVLFKIEYFTYAQIVTYVKNPYYFYRWNPTSLSRVYRADALDRVLISYQKEFELLNELGYTEGTRYATRMLLSEIRSCMRAVMVAEGFSTAIKEYKRIVNKPFIHTTVANYPYHRNPLGKHVFNFFLEKKKVYLLGIIIWMNLRFRS